MYENDYIVFPQGGLSNRLRVVFSYFQYCKEIKKKLVVLWIIDERCKGFFLDYFKPVNGIEFIYYSGTYWTQYMGRIDYYGLNSHPNKYKNIYGDLILLDKIQKKVDTIKNKLDKYISVHIRRTDLTQILAKFIDDNEFIDFINKNNNYNLFIATDNRKTQDTFYKLFKDKIKYIKFIDPSDKLRQTSLEQTIIDIFVCIYSNKFKGTTGSSLSDLIKTIRKERNIKNS